MRSSLASSRDRDRSRAASRAGDGTCTSTTLPTASMRARKVASLPSVLARSPDGRSIFETAPTTQGTPAEASLLCRSKPVGPDS
jgi:hypothetical protein